jgi:hypothetical protein
MKKSKSGLDIMNDVGKMMSKKAAGKPLDEVESEVEEKEDSEESHDECMSSLHAKIADLHKQVAALKGKSTV